MPRGTLSMKGSLHGLVYMANEQNASGPVLTMQANSELFGGVAIDGPGRLVAGQASGNRSTIKFVPNAFSSLATYGTTGLVQNTWRELLPADSDRTAPFRDGPGLTSRARISRRVDLFVGSRCDDRRL